ncbi:hypothetical protein PG994_003974 [Apiospora phragmitis]|uniref:Uncharacterized protein n=1 Tax=Apiospora phragmitis TaxID=2905665 RepID=A0ABR1W0X2_9PEZI
MASATQQDGVETPGTSSPASPRPAIAKLARSAPSPVLVHHRPQSSSFSPTCTHTIMTRLYEPNFVCSMEFMIEDQMEKGLPVSFDLLGASFADRKPVPSPRGPALRSDPLSFLMEITVDDMRSYTPQQIRTILEQRENLQEVLERQRRLTSKRSYYYPSSGSKRSGGRHQCFSVPVYDNHCNHEKPWVLSEGQECQFKCCHACRPSCEQRASLSLDGIAKGDIPPTAIAGFGFHLQGSRPLMDAGIIQNIGYRAVPWPNALAPTEDSTSCTSSICSTWSSLMNTDNLEDIFPAARPEAASMPTTPSTDSTSTPEFTSDHQPDYLMHNLDSVAHNDWTAPRTLPDFFDLDLDAHAIEDSADEPLIASSTPPRPSAPNGDVFLHGEPSLRKKPSAMMEAELEEGRFHEDHLEVVDGIAVTEESVVLGVADVMAQV